MQRDPFNCGFRPGKFVTDYMGDEQGFYVLKLKLEGHRGLDACMYQRDIFNWLFENVEEDGDAYLMRAGGTDPDYPNLTLCVQDGQNSYVLLRNFADLIAFDEKFRVEGLVAFMEAA